VTAQQRPEAKGGKRKERRKGTTRYRQYLGRSTRIRGKRAVRGEKLDERTAKAGRKEGEEKERN